MKNRLILRTVLLVVAAFTVGSVLAKDNNSAKPSISKTDVGIVNKNVFTDSWKIRSVKPGEFAIPEIYKAGEWLNVPVMPAMPLDILLLNKKIEEPWKPFGLEKCFWVFENDWVYSLDFVAKNLKGEKRLIFKETKGKVDVYLNGIKIASHSDQWQPLVVDITGKLSSKNQLVLHFAKAAPNKKADGKDISKRAPMGNYLGPNPMIYTSGIVGSVILEHTDGSLMNEIITDFSLNESFTQGKVSCKVSGKVNAKKAQVHLRLFAPDGKKVAETTLKIETENAFFNVNPELVVSNPALWWPRGYGEQNRYKAEITLSVNGRVHQLETKTIGFRKIEMPEKLLHFVVNGKPVFLRGGNWVTPNLMSDVWDAEKTGKLYDLAENANFNAFRIWGPVEAPNDKFYEMADEKGFLLWQDFSRMPFKPDEKSLQLAADKSAKIITRLKHHPSILLWCGINEDAMWWHEDYNNDFVDNGPWPGLAAAKVIEKVCKELDPSRHFMPSAPYGGVNANDPRIGSTNGYTNMWFVPGFDYLNFASEDTRISCPTLNSMKKFMLPAEIFPKDYTTLSLPGNKYPFPESWLPYTAAEAWKKTGPVEQFYDATDAASLVNRIGMAEGVYYRDVIERQRRGRPATDPTDQRKCGGYIVWKYNDSWPEVYAGKVDYFLEPYHSYYTLRAAFAPVILSFDIGTLINLWAVNDGTETVKGTVKIQLYNLEKCEFKKEIIREVTLAPGKSKVVVELDEAGIRAFRREHILFAEWKDSNGKVIARTNALADIERRCAFPDAKLDVKVINNALVITTDKFARNINLEGDANGEKLGWFFEDNYFDLLPGETKIVRILGTHSKGTITAKPWYSPHFKTVKWNNIKTNK